MHNNIVGSRGLEAIRKVMLVNIKAIEETCIQMLDDASGYIVAQPIYSQIDLPPFHRSAFDGYAYQAEDALDATRETPVALQVIETVCAGACSKKHIVQGTAIRIMTGAPIPQGANCVIKQEDTDRGEAFVHIYKQHRSGDNIRYKGEDVAKGTLVIREGEKITYSHMGVIASQGIDRVVVYRKAQVCLLTIGDELVENNTPLHHGKMYNSNIYLLKQRIKDVSCTVTALHCKDDVESVCQCIYDNYKNSDLFITVGGMSAGLKDIMHDVLCSLPVEENVLTGNTLVSPPVSYSMYKNTPILSVSGNPFAAFINFELFARPILATLCKDSTLNSRQTSAIADFELLKESTNRRYIRGWFEDGTVTLSTDEYALGGIHAMLHCNCLIDISAGTKAVHRGDVINILLIAL